MRVRVRVRVCVACVRPRARARARGLMAALPGGGPAEDGSELRSHACGVAKVETRAAASPASAAQGGGVGTGGGRVYNTVASVVCVS